MTNPTSNTERKKIIKCNRTMPCASCLELQHEFGQKKVADVFASLGPMVAAVEVKAFIIHGGLCPEA